MEPDGSVTVTTGLHSHGQGHETTFAQVAADELGVDVHDVRVVFGNTDSAVYGMGTYASRSAVIGAGSVGLAATEVAQRLRDVAALLLEASADDIVLAGGMAAVAGVPQKPIPIRTLSEFAYFAGSMRPGEIQSEGLTATRAYDPPETYSNGTCAAVVEVDIETGYVTIQRFIAVEDCGVMINPTIVEGQLAGAVAQGIGIALLEDLPYDDHGNFLAGTLMEYLYPSTAVVPDIEIDHLETPSPVTERGIKGMGEGGTIAAPAAIANAIADALAPFEVIIDRTPATPSYVLSLLRRREHQAEGAANHE
jgi:carbon-monoxide dehydrogenase large subunit